MKKRFIAIIFLICVLGLSGCSLVNDKKANEAIEKDPTFKPILEREKKINTEIYALRREFDSKRKITNSTINILRKEFSKERTKIVSEIERLKHQLDPERKLIRDEISLLKKDIRKKGLGLRNLERTIKDLERMVSKEGSLDISKAEVIRWRQRIISLEKEKGVLLKELKGLKKELEILEIKLSLLR